MVHQVMMIIAAFAACVSSSAANIAHESRRPNVIIMHVKNLLWSDLGVHVNRKDSENSTPNIDYLAYSGIILNRFYANGGLDSLLSGCHQRSQYGNKNLMTFYFERNGYKTSFTTRNNFDKIDAFERGVLDAIKNENEPFLAVADFGRLGEDIKIPFIDEIVASVVTKAHKVGVLNNTIILFLSLPADNNDSPLEINIRRTAFVYSPLLKLQQRVSNQMIHVIDLLPTLVSAANLKWRTKDRIYVDGINQWQALNVNDEERLSVYGDNFYISNYWKLSFGVNGSAEYGSIDNENMESDKDMSEYDFETYVRTIFASEVHNVLDKLSSQKIMFTRSRASVHCNLKDIDEIVVNEIKCSQLKPCLFNLNEDPCEFDNKHEIEFNVRRSHMKDVFERYLRGEKIDEVSVRSTENAEVALQDGAMVGIILGGSIVGCILVFIIVVCVKERCNRRRSVYYDRTKKKTEEPSDGVKFASGNPSNGASSDVNAISVISHNVK